MAHIHISKDPPKQTPVALGHMSLYGLGGISWFVEIYGKLLNNVLCKEEII
jgi:hypothetical protein